MSTRIYLTTPGDGTWTVPSDFNSANNTIEMIGGGAGANGDGGGGGSGGDYAKITNLALSHGASISYHVAAKGSKGSPSGRTVGGDSWFNGITIILASVGAKGGDSLSTSHGDLVYTGGTGHAYIGDNGGGGGAAASPSGNGGNAPDGNGGNSHTKTGGAPGSAGGAGQNGTDWDSTHGAGSGGGGATSTNGGSGGQYGGGGGGGHYPGNSGGDGGQGIIVITYEPVTTAAVDTNAATDIDDNSATLNGEITDVGAGDATARGFVYGTSSQSDPGDTAPASSAYDDYTSESGTFSEGTFDADITGLSAATTYYVRAWAQNSDGYAYGDEISFDTDALPPFRFTNLPGVEFDEEDTTTIYAERLNDMLERIEALEG